MDNIYQATSSSKTSTPSTTKGIAKALDTVFENLNETNSKLNRINEAFEQHQETVSIQATKFQDMYNNLNTTFQDIFSTLNMNILEIQNKVIEYTDDQKNILNILEDIRTQNSHKPLSEIINPKNKSVKNSTRYSASHTTLWNSICHKINSHQASENIDETSFKFNLEKPPSDRYNRKRLNNYIKFYLEDYIKRSEDLRQRELWSEDVIRDIITGYVGYLHKRYMSSKEKIKSNKVFNRRKARKIQKAKKRHDCTKLMDLDELGQSLSDVEKVIKPEYASPEISGEENEEDVFYIVQIPWRNQSLCELIQKLDQENEKKERSSKRQKKHKDDVNDGIWPAWALPDNHDDADHDFESDN
ncbi:hypothetical protein C2G38_2138295 [Gigaspora rosea]|uniref:Uncharacterized protein n=1 Tax=Gigaspora rosea TaxID=44941 RepID=A0A397VX88_9GLOM|nr:hypothetical protein C2G38_2138295 [Gigaspora rosea]